MVAQPLNIVFVAKLFIFSWSRWFFFLNYFYHGEKGRFAWDWIFWASVLGGRKLTRSTIYLCGSHAAIASLEPCLRRGRWVSQRENPCGLACHGCERSRGPRRLSCPNSVNLAFLLAAAQGFCSWITLAKCHFRKGYITLPRARDLINNKTC